MAQSKLFKHGVSRSDYSRSEHGVSYLKTPGNSVKKLLLLCVLLSPIGSFRSRNTR